MEKLTLIQVFAKLTARLTELELYHAIIDFDNVPVIKFSINEIEENIFEHNTEDALEILDFHVGKISQLKTSGKIIISGVEVEIFRDDLDMFVIANSEQKLKVIEELYETIMIELQFYEMKLGIIRETLEFNVSLDSKSAGEIMPSKLKIETAELALDIRQCALLFDYLREIQAIQPISNVLLAIHVSAITGFGKKLRSVEGFSDIPNIKSDKNVNKVKKGSRPSYNLNSVKSLLQRIIEQIDNDILANKGK